jgi:hypothetical protein
MFEPTFSEARRIGTIDKALMMKVVESLSVKRAQPALPPILPQFL